MQTQPVDAPPIRAMTFVIHSLAHGGAERVIVNLANAWAREGVDVSIVCMREEHPVAYPLEQSVAVIWLAQARPSPTPLHAIMFNLRRLTTLRATLRRLQPQVVIGAMTTTNVVMLLAALGMDCKTVASEHSHPPQHPLSGAWDRLRKHGYRLADLVTAPTVATQTWLQEHTHAKRVEAIPNPLQFPLPEQPPIKDLTSFDLQHKNLIIGVGRLATEKGFDMLIPAFNQIAAAHPDWHLAIIGAGDKLAVLQQLVESGPFSDRIRFVGEVGNIGHWYDAAQIYVMSSRYEGFGNTLVEAMASGCACISFDCETGPAEILRDPCDGVLLKDKTIDGLAATLDDLMRDKDKRDRLAASAIRARARYETAHIQQRWQALISQL